MFGIGVAAIQRLRIGLRSGVDEAGAAHVLVVIFLTDAFLNEDAVGSAGPLADAFFEFNSRLGGVGHGHHIAELCDETIGSVVAGYGSDGGPVVVMGGVPVGEHFADLGLVRASGPGDVNGAENQITLAEVLARVEVHVGEEPMVASWLRPVFASIRSG